MKIAHNVNDLTRRNVELVGRIEKAATRHRNLGDRISDAVATTVGSWPFIIIQSVLLAIWVVLNVAAWIRHWDPYPFILLNLALSFQAAYASPIIMMSQNRAARLADRRNQLDLQINMLSEQENTATLRLLQLLCENAGIKVEEGDVQVMEQGMEPGRLIRQIEAQERKATQRKKPPRKKPPRRPGGPA
jgi:uncharacterized membrane protein